MLCVVIGTLRIPVSQGRRADVIDVLESVRGPVLAQPGCTACHIYEEHGPEEEAVVLVERWECDAAMRRHIRSEAYGRILSAVEIAGYPPDVCFDYVSSSEGMELIERLRDVGETDHGPL
jgi:quinol monooxygenase YgiN